MSEWKPISSAPRDGTQIILCKDRGADGEPMGDAFGIFCQIAAWWGEHGTDDGEWIVYCSLPSEPELHFTPTHWMPLPAPPTDTHG